MFTKARAMMFLGSLVLPVVAPAQTGPAEPYFIAGASTARINVGSRELEGHVIATVRVGEDGRVRDVQVTENTTAIGFEPQLVRVLESARFRPAIDAGGQLVEATIDMQVELLKSTGNRPRPTAAKPDPDRAEKEKERIGRMRCADFLWEWRFLREVADDAAAMEFMPRIATSIYATMRSEAGDYVDADVWKAAPRALRETAQRCEQTPEQPFWATVFKPVMDEAVPK